MSTDERVCHGRHDALLDGSEPGDLTRARKFIYKAKTQGLRAAFGLVVSKVRDILGAEGKRQVRAPWTIGHPEQQREPSSQDEALNLQPGELVEVKSEEEILVTLDERGKHNGLAWMPEMREYCGKRFRVFKKVDRILLESSGEYRKIRNTVFLEGVMCDGRNFYACARSCFFYWREAWLRRAEEQEAPSN